MRLVLVLNMLSSLNKDIIIIIIINRISFANSLVISWLLPGTCHPSWDILSSESIRADGVEISEIYHLNNTYQ